MAARSLKSGKGNNVGLEQGVVGITNRVRLKKQDCKVSACARMDSSPLLDTVCKEA
jgi:hypothetical protein